MACNDYIPNLIRNDTDFRVSWRLIGGTIGGGLVVTTGVNFSYEPSGGINSNITSRCDNDTGHVLRIEWEYRVDYVTSLQFGVGGSLFGVGFSANYLTGEISRNSLGTLTFLLEVSCCCKNGDISISSSSVFAPTDFFQTNYY